VCVLKSESSTQYPFPSALGLSSAVEEGDIMKRQFATGGQGSIDLDEVYFAAPSQLNTWNRRGGQIEKNAKRTNGLFVTLETCKAPSKDP
jgi:hypothetical protein